MTGTVGGAAPFGRRGFLGLIGLAGAAAATGGLAGCDGAAPPAAGATLPSKVPLPPRFGVPLPLPPVARPVRRDAGADHYELTQRIGSAHILPGATTPVWGYDGVFPGPTFDVRRGRPISVRITNQLPQPTSTHLHGGVTPPDSDGYPTDLTVPAGTTFDTTSHHDRAMAAQTRPSDWTLHQRARDYTYPLDQRAATLWYHDHRMDFTGPQVWRGLAGLFLVRDDEEDALPLPRGGREIPLVLTDRSFAADGSFAYPALDPSLSMRPGVQATYSAGVQGDVILVNGAPWPELEVAACRYRFRILNASNARRYGLSLSPGGGQPLIQVGSDQGLLAAPVRHDTITVSPAERFDIVIDFSGHKPGSTVILRNTLDSGPAGQVMRFRVTGPARDDSHVPARLGRIESLRHTASTPGRKFEFHRTSVNGQDMWTVNAKVFSPSTVLARPRLDTVEKWTFTSDAHHPVHVHLGHFQVLSRNGGKPAATDAGWKDTVDVSPLEVVEVLVRFTGHRGRYLVHCHNLEHEDMAMMANIQVV